MDVCVKLREIRKSASCAAKARLGQSSLDRRRAWGDK